MSEASTLPHPTPASRASGASAAESARPARRGIGWPAEEATAWSRSAGSPGWAGVGRIPVLDVTPAPDGGRFPARAVVGEQVPIEATVIREGHDALSATAVLIDPDGVEHARLPMRLLAPGTDRYGAIAVPDRMGRWTFRVEGWSDPYATWVHAASVKIAAGVDVDLMLEEGARLLERALAHGTYPAEDAAAISDGVRGLRDAARPAQARLAAGTGYAVERAFARTPLREFVTPSADLPLQVERELALFSSWYELFPRSEGAHVGADGIWVSGTFRQAAGRLPAIAELGFDIVYLPPIHPVGQVNRKGPNNTLTPGPGDPGSPWAIGSADGGHDAVNPELGTLEDFDAFVATARENGLEVALDLALQAAPDHPWAKDHPEWFTTRADGTIAYAENPPKKYQDIYPINFDNDPEGIFTEVLRVVEHWIGHGVTVFRVDNPHTKPVAFWQRLIGEVNARHPEIIFLAEAFTRPAMMHTLGKVGFTQSYTYFTWRTTKAELTEYLTELSGPPAAYMRPNFWPNTPDILHEFLQYGGKAAFALRAVLAATMSPSWGMYSGYELCEHVAVRQGSEEYLDSEKYQYRPRDWAAFAPGGPREDEAIIGLIGQLNRVRRDHPALQRLRNIHFHTTESDAILAYSRRLPGSQTRDGRDDTVIVVVNLDPHAVHDTTVHLDLPALGLRWDETYSVVDLLTGETYRWGSAAYVRLDPAERVAHVLHLRRS